MLFKMDTLFKVPSVSHGDQLLFGDDSSSEDESSVLLGPKSAKTTNNQTNNLLFGAGDTTMDSTQNSTQRPIVNAKILCYDSDD